ncbi:metabotropic glutamate receptor 8-like [Asterias rubens]|uniref:metabotropic glutamate receptor 8-like n=1 Tax=Asterias rubens TaxID=7604 RepID=UPI001455AC2B|nr:metabotropic glutamate receptor 8-like [Asterias rubens]
MAKTNYRCLLAMVLFFFFAVCSVSSSSLVNKFAAPRQCHVYKKSGHLILGGMFAITENYPSTCNYSTDEIQFTMLLPEAMAFAIYEVNRRSDLLPNITLGFEIWDHGVSEDAAVGISMSLLQEPPRGPSKTCDLPERKKLVGIVGPESSAMSVFVSKIAQTYRVPVVSYWATSNELSNKARFPYFMRSVPPDQLQAGAIVELLLNFGWDYIAVIYTVDSYGIHGAREVVSQAERKNICIAMSAPLSELHTERDMLQIALRIKRLDSVRIVVMFSSTGPIAYTFLSQILKVGLPYKITWIGSDGWGYELLQNDLLKELVEGSIFVRLNSPKQPEFERYLNTIDPRTDATSEWFTNYWRERLAYNCSDTDALASCVVPLPDGFSTEYNTAGAIDAVNVFAYALHSLWMETCPSGSANCTLEAAQIDGDNFLKHLRNVTFTSSTGPFTLNENGDTEGIYLFENLQYVEGQHRFRDVGQWNSRMGNGERLQLFQDELQWSGLSSSQGVPRSTCRKICSAGVQS